MAEQSAISWTDATFNPWWGCWPVSPGCALCYADREASRHGYDQLWQREGPRRTFGEKHWNEPLVWARNLPKKLGRRPRVFCASMADIGEDHPTAEQERPKLWGMIEKTPELDWLLLTKRVGDANRWLPASWTRHWPPHVWFGFSAEDQPRYDERIEDACYVGADITFCSYEPALGVIDFRLRRHPRLSWVIAGGESAVPARRARPSHPDWFRSARDQCLAAGVAFHFKQWGEWAPWIPGAGGSVRHISARDGKTGTQPGYVTGEYHARADTEPIANMGRKAAGRLLDGRTWDEFPVSLEEPLDTGPGTPTE